MTSYALSFSSALAGVSGLLFFFLFFTVMALWIFRPGARDEYQQHARIPLKEQDK